MKPVTALLCIVCLAGGAVAAEEPTSPRQTISLDGTWQIAEGTMEKVPAKFSRQVPVPGLADMAVPPFPEERTASRQLTRDADGPVADGSARDASSGGVDD